MNGCEMCGCNFWNGKNCTDAEPIYDKVCRLNDFWNSEKGIAIIEEYEEISHGCDLSCFNHPDEPSYCKDKCEVRERVKELINESEAANG